MLLAASSGTAYAQSIGFDKTSGSVMEKAFVGTPTANSSKHPPLEIKVRVKGLPPVGDAGRDSAVTALGTSLLVAQVPAAPALTIYRVQPMANGVPQDSVALEDGAIASDLFNTTDEVTLLVAPWHRRGDPGRRLG